MLDIVFLSQHSNSNRCSPMSLLIEPVAVMLAIKPTVWVTTAGQIRGAHSKDDSDNSDSSLKYIDKVDGATRASCEWLLHFGGVWWNINLNLGSWSGIGDRDPATLLHRRVCLMHWSWRWSLGSLSFCRRDDFCICRRLLWTRPGIAPRWSLYWSWPELHSWSGSCCLYEGLPGHLQQEQFNHTPSVLQGAMCYSHRSQMRLWH